MISRKIPWPAVFTYMTQETLLQSVTRQHLGYFHKDLFKEKFLDNKRTIESMYRGKRYISPYALPAVFMGYEIDDNPQNTLINSSFPYESGAHWIGGPLNTFYWRIFSNPYNKITMHASFIRKRFTINIRYLFPDRFQQDDFYNYLINTFPYGGPGIKFNVSSSIYAPIPSNMIEYLAVMQGYDLTDPRYIKRLDRELEEYSSGLIRRKKVLLQDRTSMFFMTYWDQLMKILQPERPERDDGEQVGQLKTRFGITETLQFEPHIPTMFITNVPGVVHGRKTPDKYRPQIFGGHDIDSRIFYTRSLDVDSVNKMPPLVGAETITVEEFSVGPAEDGSTSNRPPEIIQLSDFLSNEHLAAITIIKKRLHGNPSESYFIFLYSVWPQ